MKKKIIPPHIGYGFSMHNYDETLAKIYTYESNGIYHNYYFNEYNNCWPDVISHALQGVGLKIDGFSPNMNKELHAGHLKNLALANALSKLLPKAQMVAFLGYSLGSIPNAISNFKNWCKFLNYTPTIHTTLEFELNDHFQSIFHPGKDDYKGCLIWPGKTKPLVAVKSNGQLTYIGNEVLFHKTHSITHYLTGSEQIEHFRELWLESSHIPFGLVVNKNGGKLKSREEVGILAEDLINKVIENIKTPNEDSKKIAWNILAWNFLKTNRKDLTIFSLEDWCNPNSPGMKITYTYARLYNALKDISFPVFSKKVGYRPEDYSTIYFCNYYQYFLQKSIEEFSLHPIANYLFDLTKLGNTLYEQEKIKNGRIAFIHIMKRLLFTIESCMEVLGLFPLKKV